MVLISLFTWLLFLFPLVFLFLVVRARRRLTSLENEILLLHKELQALRQQIQTPIQPDGADVQTVRAAPLSRLSEAPPDFAGGALDINMPKQKAACAPPSLGKESECPSR